MNKLIFADSAGPAWQKVYNNSHYALAALLPASLVSPQVRRAAARWSGQLLGSRARGLPCRLCIVSAAQPICLLLPLPPLPLPGWPTRRAAARPRLSRACTRHGRPHAAACCCYSCRRGALSIHAFSSSARAVL